MRDKTSKQIVSLRVYFENFGDMALKFLLTQNRLKGCVIASAWPNCLCHKSQQMGTRKERDKMTEYDLSLHTTHFSLTSNRGEIIP